MRSDKHIFIAFIFNLLFSAAELVGGIFTGSIAIISDAIHDLGDAMSIAISALLERKSKRSANNRYTYGYRRLSVLGGAINAIFLLAGSVMMVYHAAIRLVSPSPIYYDGMIVLAILGVIVNSLAAYATHGGHSINEKTVNLHMLEDVLGWIVVLLGAVVMNFTDWWFIDPLMSIGVAVFIFVHAVKNTKSIMDIFMDKAPENMSAEELMTNIMSLDAVKDVHHIHIWTIDGNTVLATMHVKTNGNMIAVKQEVRHACIQMGISHVTLEMESEYEPCHETKCNMETTAHKGCHHHHG